MTRRLSSDRVEVYGEEPTGFYLYEEFVSPEDQEAITQWCEAHVATEPPDLERCPQDYYQQGHRALPNWANSLGERMVADGVLDYLPDHLLLIRYAKGTGITAHTDPEIYGDSVAGLTLGSSRLFELIRPGRGRMRALLLPGDLYVMSGEARYEWKHWISHEPQDEFQGRTYKRADGFSATWRQVNTPVT